MKGFPPDPYEVLGVEKDARLPEIRSAHRKLVLKCHPDKVQDAALKAIRQDEVHKIQQAYELLSDDTKRQQYDDQVKLFELRKEMGKGNPTPRSNPFGYKVETAGPRANSYARLASNGYKYAGAAPRSHEDLYNEPMKYTPKKSTSYESATRDRDRRQLARDKRARAKERIQSEKARDKDRRERSHKDKTKSKDKERKSQTEEK
ncbi:DnaJ-domain-containing protein, partial [Acephala macrosclerotiorum]